MGKRAASGFLNCISSDLYSLPSEAILPGRVEMVRFLGFLS